MTRLAPHARHVLAALMGLATLLSMTPLHAQPRPSVMVVRAPRVASSLQADIERALAATVEIVSSSDYTRAAKRMRAPAHSQEAIVALLPGMGIGLVVTVETTTRDAGRYLRLTYRSAETGDEVLRDELPYRGGPLPSSYSSWVASQTRLALSTLSTRPGHTTTPSRAAPRWRTPRPRAPAPTIAPELSDETAPELRDEPPQITDATEPASDGSDTLDDGTHAEAETTDDEVLPPRVLQMDGAVGLGLGQRAVQLPTQAGTRQLDVGPFLLVDGAIRGRLRASEALHLTLALRYITSVALTAESTPAAGVPQAVPLRSQHMDATVGPHVRVSRGQTTVWLGFQLGYALQDLRGLIEITMPRYSLSGPLARVEIAAHVNDGKVMLWLAPQAQWIGAVDDNLARVHVKDSGLGLAGEIGASVRISAQFLLEASYREGHVWLDTEQSSGFHDVSRAFSARLVVQR